MIRTLTSAVVALILAVPVAAGPVAATHDGNPTHATFQRGDVFVAIGDGKVEWRLPDGTLNSVLDTGVGGLTTGMAFDSDGHLYVTNFNSNAVWEFDTSGNLIGPFGSGYNCDPESIVFDATGNAYIGQADCAADVLKFDPSGSLVDTFDVPIEDRGSDWIDLVSDQCTLRYTSEGDRLLQFDVCTRQALPDFTDLGDIWAFGLRTLPDGRVLLADASAVWLLSPTGATERTYDLAGNHCWFALAVQPDVSSFWATDGCSRNVYRFDMTSGAIVASFTATGTNEVGGVAVYGEPRAGVRRECDTEDMSGQFGRIDPVGESERVTVKYDRRILAPGATEERVAGIARRVKERAEQALDFYEQLDLPTKTELEIQISCKIEHVFLDVTGAAGYAGINGLVQLRADYIEGQLAAAARDGFPFDGAWNDPGAGWKNLVDHEIFHTVQWAAGNSLAARWLGGDHTFTESPAMLAQDLFAETDDLDETAGSYLSEVRDFATNDSRLLDVPVHDLAGEPQYQAAGALQYWAERFGPQDEANLEQRVARFLNALVRSGCCGGEMHDFGRTIDYDYATAQYGDDGLAVNRTLDALRDYYVAHFALRAANVSAQENARYAILDAETGHGLPAGLPPGSGLPAYQELQTSGALDISAGPDDAVGDLQPTEGEVFLTDLPPATVDVAIEIAADAADDPDGDSALRVAFIPIGSDGSVVVDPVLMPRGPQPGESLQRTVGAPGRSAFAVVLVAGNRAVSYQVHATPVIGEVGLTILEPTAAEPFRVGTAAEPVVVRAVPTVAGDVPISLDTPDFVLRIDQLRVPLSSALLIGGAYRIEGNIPDSIGAGTYPMTLEFAGRVVDVPGGLTIDASLPRRSYPARSFNVGDLGQGESASATVSVGAGAENASFTAAWTGSDFNLTLTSPSSRIIGEDSIDPDVTVDQTGTSVTISVATPEAGEWQLTVTGVDVPTPEPVTLAVAEVGTPIHSEVFVQSSGEAGRPIQVQFALADQVLGVRDATVVAAVTDPAGQQRRFVLHDDGGHADGGAGDGVYAAEIWATNLAGGYTIVVTADGIDATGVAFMREGSASVTLSPIVDGDGDGVSDAAEVQFETNPADPADGLTDHDGDGLGLVAELTQGLNPHSWDTDFGGEPDGSELGGGRDPRLGDDDAAAERPIVGAQPTDGRLIELSVSTAGGTGSVHLWRLQAGELVDLGTHPGTGATLTDGPLPAGEYLYRAIAVSPGGADSTPAVFGPIRAADDVTAPDFRLVVNDRQWETSLRQVSVIFADLSEAPSEMRLALTEEELSGMPWQPFSALASVTLPAVEGQHFVYGEVRDAAANASAVRSSFAFLVDTTAPSSDAGPLDPEYSSSGVDVPYTATDDVSGVASVELWWRYRVDGTNPWSSWSLGPSATSSPIGFTFTSGPGDYEFFTIAVDEAGTRETAPASADAGTRYVAADSTPPVSQAGPLDATYATSSVAVPYTASDDASGISSVELWSRYRKDSAASWTVWSLSTAASASPIDFTFALGDGLYEFYSVAVDVAGNREAPPAVADVGTRREAVNEGAWTWGSNSDGQLGHTSDATCFANPCSLTPAAVPSFLDIEAVAGGRNHTVSLRTDGTVWAWGDNGNGQLGDGRTTDRSAPVRSGTLTAVAKVEAGNDHTLALRSDGTLWAWGDNAYGQLGDGTTKDRKSPIQVPGLTNVVAIAGGTLHTLAVKADGTVWAWGYNGFGQLGDGTTTNRKTPVQVQGLTSIIEVAAGDHTSYAIASDGTLWAWGRNGRGELGDGTQVQRLTPVEASVGPVIRVAAGGGYALAIVADGTVWAWGDNIHGQLGDGTAGNWRITPVQSIGLQNMTAVAAGGAHSVAMAADGTLWSWGHNGYGQLGDGTTVNRLVPIAFPLLEGTMVFAAGSGHTIAAAGGS